MTKEFDITVLTGTSNPEKVPRTRYVVDPYLKILEKRSLLPKLVKNRYGKLIERSDVVYAAYAYTFIPVNKKLGRKVVVHLHDYKLVSPSSVILNDLVENLSICKLIIESFEIRYLEHKSIKFVLLNIGEVLRMPILAKRVAEADKVIVASKRHAELLMKTLPKIRGKLEVVYNPPSPLSNINKEPAEVPTFLYLGGESYLKGFCNLLQAVGEFLKKYRKIKFFAGKYTSKL